MIKGRTLLLGVQLGGIGIIAAIMIGFCLSPIAKHIVINITPSAPLGFYWSSSPTSPLHHGELVMVNPKPWVIGILVSRHYLPRPMTLLKHIIALEGDHVCLDNYRITINDMWVGSVEKVDYEGRPLPHICFCRKLKADEIMVMNLDYQHSFDSRYFGTLTTKDVVGRASPLLTWEAHR